MKKKRIVIPISIISLIVIYFIFSTLIIPQPKLGLNQSKIDEIEKVMDRIYNNGQLSGVILVSAKGKIIFQKPYGFANLEWNIPNTLDTKFRIASATKPFTVMLILQLVEEGKLDLDGKLTDYLPDFPAEKGKEITIHQLLTHTSGILGEWKIPNLTDIERLYYSREKLFNCIVNKEVSFEPGEGREYSNFGFALLGLIIEKVSGKSYAELLQEKICKPAGMKNTIPDQNVPLITNRASGYDYNYLTGLQNSTDIDMSFVFAYGHLLSTAEDLYLFDKALYGEKLLSKKFKQLFFNKYGWFPFNYTYGKNGKKIWCSNLDGSVNGFGSHIQRIEKDSLFITILRNMKEKDNQIVVKWPNFMASRILAILYDEEYDLPKKSGVYEVFHNLLNSDYNTTAARYKNIKQNLMDQFYFEKKEVEILSEYLSSNDMSEQSEEFKRIFINGEEK